VKLHEAIALRKGEVGRNKAKLTEIYKRFQKPVIFNGFVKTYEPVDDDGEKLPGEAKRVQHNVAEDLAAIRESLGTLWSTYGSVEVGNCTAKGDVIVGGETILENVPVTMLLFLENQLTDLRTTVEAIPTLSPDFDWEKDENSGLYKTDVVKTHRNVKHMKAIVKYPHSEHHPAQTEMVEEPKLAGYWNNIQQSGAMPTTRKAVLLARVGQMLDAVRAARARANGNDAPKADFSPILAHIFA